MTLNIDADGYHTLFIVSWGVAFLAVGIILGMEMVTVAAYRPSPLTPRPEWVGLVEAVRAWMIALTVLCIGTGLTIDHLGLEEESV